MATQILFVDDEPSVLRSYQRLMGLDYELDTAEGAEQALQLLESNGPYGVVVSDMRMPGMNGAEFLSVVRQNYPDTVRMLLTGQADMNDTISAVNNGRIFRFLSKPCPPEVLGGALDEALELYRLRFAEKELLEKTLKGTIKLLADILSIISPDLFSHSVKVRKLAVDIAKQLGLRSIWKVEVASLLSQIGCITVPEEIMEKRHKGLKLNETEEYTFLKHIPAGQKLIKNIPRLEEIAEAISYQEKLFDGGGYPNNAIEGDQIPIISRILKVAHDYEQHIGRGKSQTAAMGALHAHASWYDPDVIEALKTLFAQDEEEYIVKEIKALFLQPGMLLAEGVRTKGDLLLVSERQEVSEAMCVYIQNFAENDNIIEPIKILVKPKLKPRF